MIRWLRSLLSRSEPEPDAQSPAPEWYPPEPTEAETAIMIAFQKSPDRKSLRERVVRLLEARLEALLQPLGFQRQNGGWLAPVPKGQVVVQIKRFREGVDATLVVEFRPRPGARPRDVSPDRLSTQLPNFVQMGERTFVRRGSIDYAFADHDPSVLDFPLAVLRDRALPWVMELSGGRYPEVKAFRDRPLRSGQA